jgi:hypothetical protein
MRTVLVAGLVLAFLSSFTACDETVVIDDGWPPSQPAGILELIESSFNERVIGDVEDCLTADFTFYFDEDDVGKQTGDYTIPESWGKDKFTEVAGYMFNEAHTIQMEIDTSNVGAPGDDDNIYFARDIEVRLLVMVDAVNGYLADGVCDFEFVDVESGEPDNWVISNWQDRTWPTVSGGRNVTPASIGFILAVFD